MKAKITQVMVESDILEIEKVINISSGTPTMTTCWVFLQQSGAIPNARLIQGRPKEYARKFGKSHEEVKFETKWFPTIEAGQSELNQLESSTKKVEKLKAQTPNYGEALASFNRASQLHPTYRVAKLNAAICLEKTGQYKKAAQVYEGLVKDYVEDPSVFMAYGNALLLSVQTGLAIEQFKKVITLDDKNLSAKNNLAAAYLRKGEGERSR